MSGPVRRLLRGEEEKEAPLQPGVPYHFYGMTIDMLPYHSGIIVASNVAGEKMALTTRYSVQLYDIHRTVVSYRDQVIKIDEGYLMVDSWSRIGDDFYADNIYISKDSTFKIP